MEIVVCPYCQTRVAASGANNCPSCGGNLPLSKPVANSNNPFVDAPNDAGNDSANPYQTPSGAAHLDDRSSDTLRIPAIVLVIMGAIWTPYMFVVAWVMIAEDWEARLERPEQLIGQTFGHFLPSLIGLFSFIGSICMLTRRGLLAARIGAILSCIPFCGPCFLLGIPFGIWALSQLWRPAVVATFDLQPKPDSEGIEWRK